MQSDIAAIGWLDELDARHGPRYLQIVRSMENAIASGALRAGDRLPPQRAVAARLGVDLTTVTRAYDEARKRELLIADGARGTFVAARRIELAPMVDLSLNIPPPPADADLGALLRLGLDKLLLHADADLLMTYHLGGGSPLDRAAGALWLAPMLGRIDADHLTASPGAQAALCALILALTRPGDVILSEPLIYPGLRAAAAQLGRRLEDVEADDAGMIPDALERACIQFGAKLLYLNPTLQNPTAVTMPERRRRAIVKLASKLDLQVIEDDPYWLLAHDAPPPLARLAPQRVHYISTLSKCLSPGLRTAFVQSPDAARRTAFLDALRAFSLMCAPLTTVLVTQWINDGTAGKLLAGVRTEARARQQLAAQTLSGMPRRPHVSQDGLHLWHPLPGYWSAQAFARAARAQGLAITPSDAFAQSPDAPAAIRISLGEGSERKRLAGGLARLSALLARKPQDEPSLVI